jgi:hypothetical protein
MKADNFITKAAYRRYGWNPEIMWERGAFLPRQKKEETVAMSTPVDCWRKSFTGIT